MKLHHIGFVVKDISKASQNFEKDFGLKIQTDVIIDKIQNVKVLFLASSEDSTQIELIEPLNSNSPVHKFLEKGGGLHHLCFEVNDIKKELSETSKDKHIRIICPAVKGAGHDNRLISFLHVNKDTPNGYIIEYVEAKTGNISH